MEFAEVKPLSRLIAAACALALSSCATGFDRGELRTKLFAATGRTTDADIAKVLALKSQVRRPFSMGVCTDFVASSADSAGSADSTITPDSSSSVSVSRTRPRCAPERAPCTVCNAFISDFSAGHAIQHNALNASCQSCGLSGMLPVSWIDCS